MVGQKPDLFFMKWITVLFTLFIIAIVILADFGILPRVLDVVYDIPHGDKVGHFVLFGILNFLLTLTFTRSRQRGTAERVALSTGLVLALLITLEEFSQIFFSSRTFDLGDLLASFAGVALGGLIAFRLNRRK